MAWMMKLYPHYKSGYAPIAYNSWINGDDMFGVAENCQWTFGFQRINGEFVVDYGE